MRMRAVALAILAAGTALPTGLALAQVRDTDYRVCMQVYGRVNYTECRFTSLPQCKATASGRAAQCALNPYFARAEAPAGRRRRHVE